MMTKTFAAQIENLEEMRNFIKDYAVEIGFDKQNIARLELITEEVFVNIINHGYSGKGGSIEIDCSQPDESSLKIVITDYGIPFDPIANAKDIDINAPLEERTYGGYGIFLILKVMDEVNYKRKDNANILTMVKRKCSPR